MLCEAKDVEELLRERHHANEENSRTCYYRREKEKNKKVFVYIEKSALRELEIIQVYNEQLIGRRESLQSVVSDIINSYIVNNGIQIKEMYAKLREHQKKDGR